MSNILSYFFFDDEFDFLVGGDLSDFFDDGILEVKQILLDVYNRRIRALC